jgi:hypothetical protein
MPGPSGFRHLRPAQTGVAWFCGSLAPAQQAVRRSARQSASADVRWALTRHRRTACCRPAGSSDGQAISWAISSMRAAPSLSGRSSNDSCTDTSHWPSASSSSRRSWCAQGPSSARDPTSIPEPGPPGTSPASPGAADDQREHRPAISRAFVPPRGAAPGRFSPYHPPRARRPGVPARLAVGRIAAPTPRAPPTSPYAASPAVCPTASPASSASTPRAGHTATPRLLTTARPTPHQTIHIRTASPSPHFTTVLRALPVSVWECAGRSILATACAFYGYRVSGVGR